VGLIWIFFRQEIHPSSPEFGFFRDYLVGQKPFLFLGREGDERNKKFEILNITQHELTGE
jgi:hypothetical protein